MIDAPAGKSRGQKVGQLCHHRLPCRVGHDHGYILPELHQALAAQARALEAFSADFPVRESAEKMIAEKAYLQEVYTNGAQKASAIARKTLRKVYKKVGFVEKPF